MKSKVIVGLAALGLAASATSAFAQENYHAPWRGDFWGTLGVSAGESKFDNECDRFNVFNCDHRDTAWAVRAGGKFSSILGMELGYTDFGKVRAAGGDTNAWAANVSLTAGVPIGDRFDIFGKGGAVYGRTDVSADPTTLFDTGHKSGWGTTWGVGATFAITPNWQIRADWDRYRLDFVGGRQNVDMASAGIQYRF